MEYGLEHRKSACTARKAQECYVRTTRIGTGTRLGTGTGTGTKLETEILRTVLVDTPSSSAELNSRNLRSQCEAVIAVLQGLMSSEVELVQGV